MKIDNKGTSVFTLILILILLTASLCISGCTGSAGKEKVATEESTSLPIQKTSGDKNLTMGVMWAINNIDPLVCEETNELVTEYLVKCNNDFSLKPYLATSWKAVDNNTWEFELKKNVSFSNGDPFTAEDVKFSLEWDIKNNKKLDQLTKIGSINVLDNHTLQIKTKEPNPVLPETLHYSKAVIFSPKSIDKNGEMGVPIGTGPFKIESYDDKVYTLVFVKNDYWWGGKPRLDKITFKTIEDPNTRAMAIESGEIDYTLDVPYNEVDRLDALPGISVEKFNTANEYILETNANNTALSDKGVRQALSYGIDREDMAKNVLFGVGRPAIGIFLPEMHWVNSDLKPYNYDPEKAKRLLTEAGWVDSNGDGIREKDGKTLKLGLLTYPNRPGLPPIGETMAAQYKNLGIDIKYEVMEWGGISDRLKSGDWNLLLSTMGVSNVADPSYVFNDMYITGGDGNRGGYSNPKLDAMITEANGIADLKKRYAKFNEIQAFVHEEQPIIPVCYYGCAVAKKDSVKGLVFDTTVHGFFLNPEIYIES
ncbi:peptide ABC transporter substrate-binding protein [Methanosarcina sp. Ant1]|nr:peptide ABC transporter substrate-binding protein [Methanosarcina sp. Ant1]